MLVLVCPLLLMSKGENDMVFEWCHCILNIPFCCGKQTPLRLPSSPKGEIVGNMMQSVVLDGNPLNEDEDM